MVRCSVVWYSRLLAAVFALAAGVAATDALAQDRSTQDRLDRVERDLNMLQRQVYRGAPTSLGAPPGSGGGNAADVEIRMERLESQMRELTGRVEEVANGIDRLKQRVEQVNADIDVRLGDAAGGAAPAAPPPRGGGFASRSAAAAEAGRFPPAPPTGGLMPPGTVVPAPPGGGGLSPIFNTLTPPGTAPSRPLPEPPEGPPPAETASAGGLPRGSANQQFNYAFGLVKQANYAEAETALKAFIAAHPNDQLVGSAQYWLGQTYYERKKFGDAASAFAEGYKRYPKGQKAADNLLYLGMSLGRADQKKNACVALTQLDEAFPHAGKAVKDRAIAERKRLGCG
jgi:tol-pal system protein YbgF